MGRRQPIFSAFTRFSHATPPASFFFDYGSRHAMKMRRFAAAMFLMNTALPRHYADGTVMFSDWPLAAFFARRIIVFHADYVSQGYCNTPLSSASSFLVS